MPKKPAKKSKAATKKTAMADVMLRAKVTRTKTTAAKNAAVKTVQTSASVDAFLRKVDAARQADCRAIGALLEAATGEKPRMWGTAIVGYGSLHYQYESGREGDWPVVGFSPRKQNLTIYVMPGLERYAPQLARLGKHTIGKSCLYIKRLADVDQGVLAEIVRDSVARTRRSVTG